jgi:hypothetical protein
VLVAWLHEVFLSFQEALATEWERLQLVYRRTRLFGADMCIQAISDRTGCDHARSPSLEPFHRALPQETTVYSLVDYLDLLCLVGHFALRETCGGSSCGIFAPFSSVSTHSQLSNACRF